MSPHDREAAMASMPVDRAAALGAISPHDKEAAMAVMPAADRAAALGAMCWR